MLAFDKDMGIKRSWLLWRDRLHMKKDGNSHQKLPKRETWKGSTQVELVHNR